MRDFLKLVMYAGGVVSIVAFALPYWGNQVGGVWRSRAGVIALPLWRRRAPISTPPTPVVTAPKPPGGRKQRRHRRAVTPRPLRPAPPRR